MTWMRRFLLLIVLASVVAVGVPGCAPAPPPAPSTLTYRAAEDPPTLDPFRAGDDNSLVYIHLINDGLVEYVPGTVDVRPAVAESWTLSPDGLTYTFRLRRGVRFHNGREVTAQDVVYSLRRALTPGTHSSKATFLAMLKGAADFSAGRATDLPGVASPDPATIVCTLEYPYGSFLTILAGEAGSIVPHEVYDDPSQAYLKHPVGCGPYRFESWEPKVSLALSRFPDHWTKAPAGGIERILFRMIFDSTTALEEYKTGGVDFTQEIPPGQRQEVARSLPKDLHSGTRLSIFYVGFNHRASLFKDHPLLRRALLHAIDTEFIVRVLDEGKDTVASGVIPPGLLGHRPGGAPAYDPDLAARLLAEAGFPKGRGLPELTYVTNDTTGFRQIAERIQSDWARIGVKTALQMSDFAAFMKALEAFKTDTAAVYRFTWFADWPDPDSFVTAQFGTGGVGNYGLYSSAALDQLLDQGRREPDPAQRDALYRKADTMLMEDAALIPLYWYGQDVLLKPRFTGLKLSPLGVFGIPWEEVTAAP